jgi:hypothetical protein
MALSLNKLRIRVTIVISVIVILAAFLALDRKFRFLPELIWTQSLVPDTSKEQPGQVLSEVSRDLGGAFRNVSRSIVMPPEHWEAVGHFSYLYYRDQRLCSGDYSISPSKRYALFLGDHTDSLFLFDAEAERITKATKRDRGTPRTFTWDETTGWVFITFYEDSKNENKIPPPQCVQFR